MLHLVFIKKLSKNSTSWSTNPITDGKIIILQHQHELRELEPEPKIKHDNKEEFNPPHCFIERLQSKVSTKAEEKRKNPKYEAQVHGVVVNGEIFVSNPANPRSTHNSCGGGGS